MVATDRRTAGHAAGAPAKQAQANGSRANAARASVNDARTNGHEKNGTARPRRQRLNTPEEKALKAEIDALGQWFHNLRLPVEPGGRPTVQTAPDHFLGDFPHNFWKLFSHAIPEDLSGKSVLDIGCNGGFYSLEMHRRGARRVLGVDHDPKYLRQAAFARGKLGLTEKQVEFRQLEVYDIGQLREQFDLVLFMGVFYHLKHPLYALEEVAKLVQPGGGLLVFQTMERGHPTVAEFEEDYPITERDVFYDVRFPRMYFIEHQYAGDWTNWWIPNPAASMAMLRSCGLTVIERPCGEVYICEKKAEEKGQ